MSSDNRLIAKNTLYLYMRMGFSMCVKLYTSRVVLQTLGVLDYGLWNVVAGVVVMFCFLNTSMAGCTSRFISVELGRKGDVQEVFSATMAAHIMIACIVLLLGETVGLWFLENKLVIPDDRMLACRVVYQLSLLNAMLGLTQVPYNASIMAYERMGTFAAFDIIQIILRLAIVCALPMISYDRLIVYGILSAALTVGTCLAYRVYCTHRLPSCRLKLSWNWELLKPMLVYSGWDLYGNASVMARTQGVNMLLNMFFTATMNAASAVAVSVQNAVMSFGWNVLTAVRPQIFKSYAAGDTERCCLLIYKGSMFISALMLLLVIPLEVEMDYVLKLWLKTPPDYAATFSRCVLIYYLIGTVADAIQVGIHATGRIKVLSLVNGTIFFMVVPFSYFMFESGAVPTVAYLFNIGAVMVSLVFVSCLFHKQIGAVFSPVRILFRIVAPLALVGAIAYVSGRWVSEAWGEPSLMRVVAVTLVTTIVIGVLTCCCVFSKEDRITVVKKIKRFL